MTTQCVEHAALVIALHAVGRFLAVPDFAQKPKRPISLDSYPNNLRTDSVQLKTFPFIARAMKNLNLYSGHIATAHSLLWEVVGNLQNSQCPLLLWSASPTYYRNQWLLDQRFLSMDPDSLKSVLSKAINILSQNFRRILVLPLSWLVNLNFREKHFWATI